MFKKAEGFPMVEEVGWMPVVRRKSGRIFSL